MGRRLEPCRPDLGLLLVIAACHSGQRLDLDDYELSSATREASDVGSAEALKMEAVTHDPGSVPGVALEPSNPLPDVPRSEAPVEASVADQADDKGRADAGGYMAPSGDGGADDPDAGNAHDGGAEDDAGPPPSPTQVCPAAGGGPQEVRLLPDGNADECWAGETWELGTTFASGALSKNDAVTLVGAYLFGGAKAAKTQVYDADGNPLRGCVVIDDTANRQWREIAFEGATCQGAAFARVTAHASPDGDL